MDLSLIQKLNEVSYKNLKQVGGKAASLGEMLQMGTSVPPGYVITTKAFNTGMSDDLKKDIFAAFNQLGVPRVAVRSSAIAEDSKAASWAGQLESYLNTTQEGLIQAVKNCWTSIKSEHATEYAIKNGVSEGHNAVAVVVQAMVNSDISGVLFTANPVTQSQDEFLIEAAYGLGELLVQGEITPESIIASRDGSIISRQASRQHTKLVYRDGANKKVAVSPQNQIVNDELLGQLVGVANKIEQHYGTPQDIEWAVEGGKLYIVQSRPITTL